MVYFGSTLQLDPFVSAVEVVTSKKIILIAEKHFWKQGFSETGCSTQPLLLNY